MDWFERLTGFAETDPKDVRRRLRVEDGRLVSSVNGRSWGVGVFELARLGELRRRVAALPPAAGRTSVRVIRADVRDLHRRPDCAGALFQVASQFNMLEMIGPHATPEDGVGIYELDPTQGPACAISAGAATIWRNYFVPVDGRIGQTEDHQLNGFAALGEALAARLGADPAALWTLRNGYLSCSAATLAAVSELLARVDEADREALRGELAIGLHRDVEVTAAPGPVRPRVSQAFCSAVPVGYNQGIAPAPRWRALATLVLEAAYEATLLAGVLAAAGGGSNRVLLTLLGGGAFGNDQAWILAAIERAAAVVAGRGLDVIVVSHGPPSAALADLPGRCARAAPAGPAA